MAKNDICVAQISFLIGQRLSQGYFLAYKNLLHQTDDLPALAPRVARSTDLIQATLWCRQFLCLRPRPLPGGFPRPINVKDHAGVSCSINKSAGVSLFVQRAREQIGEKEGAQGFGGFKAHTRKIARECRAGGQFLAVEQGHEGLRKGEEPLVKLLQGAFATDGVALRARRESRSPRNAQSGGEQSAPAR